MRASERVQILRHTFRLVNLFSKKANHVHLPYLVGRSACKVVFHFPPTRGALLQQFFHLQLISVGGFHPLMSAPLSLSLKAVVWCLLAPGATFYSRSSRSCFLTGPGLDLQKPAEEYPDQYSDGARVEYFDPVEAIAVLYVVIRGLQSYELQKIVFSRF